MYADPSIELVECDPVSHPPVINAVQFLLKGLLKDIDIEKNQAR